MKRLHIHIGVENLDEAVRFYSDLFDARPVKTKPEYARWMLDDPAVNFAVSTKTGHWGVDHLGIQVDDEDELQALRARIRGAGIAALDEGETECCYSRSDKSWVKDPGGVAWEAYRTMGDAAVYHSPRPADGRCCASDASAGACC